MEGHTSPDQIIHDIGGCGRYQIRMSVTVHVTKTIVCFTVMSMILMSATPPWWCEDTATISADNMTSCKQKGNGSEVDVCPVKTCYVANNTKCSSFIFGSRMKTIVSEMESCAICQGSLMDGKPTVCVTQKGCDGILAYSDINGNDIDIKPGDTVHKQCRKDFTRPKTNPQNIVKNVKLESQKSLRSNSENFDFKTRCLFCWTLAKYCPFSRKRSLDVYPVRSLEFQNTIEKQCASRCDQWAKDISSRLSQVGDLPAADAIYHQACNVNFRTGKGIPKAYKTNEPPVSKRKSPGRPEHIDQSVAFQKIVNFLESVDEGHTVTVTDLVNMMEDSCGERAYTNKHMKRKIKDFFGDRIVISSIEGKPDLVSLKHNVSSIVHDFYRNSKELSDEQKKRNIIETAAKLLKVDINTLESTKSYYPCSTDVASLEKNFHFLPSSLKTFLGTLIGQTNKIKTASIGQSLIQACRPKSLLVPLQFGLGVQLHHHFGSRFLIDLLNNLGFCCSYWEVQKFESNAAAMLSNHEVCQEKNTSFLQFIADNVDHNIRTLDGLNTFHGMGIISASTPGTDVTVCVPRIDVSLDELTELGRINIKYFLQPYDSKGDVILFEELPKAEKSYRCEPIDIFSKLIWPLRQNKPSWSGFMQMFDKVQHTFPKKASVTFLPMIDLNPSDINCVYTTLHFVSDQAQRYSQTPILTFDQPLFQKATDIIRVQDPSSPLKQIVLRLGAFHTEMSFLGCIGHLMAGSGLQQSLETVYASNAVTHMLTGKAIQRALRGHMLVDTALTVLLLENTLNVLFIDIEQQDNHTIEIHDSSINWFPETYPEIVSDTVIQDQRDEDLKKEAHNLALLYDKIESGVLTSESVGENDSIKTLSHALFNDCRQMLSGNRTAKLWMQYMDMVAILQQFIRAERTGNWQLHLIALRKMLPYFASSGHNLYLKSAYIYLQNMVKLEETNPDILQAFQNGFHVVRRSDRYWAGLSTDLLIEQMLMRSLKTTGGLTRGRGMSENQRILWLHSLPLCLQINNAMQEFSETTYQTSDQHKETGKSRVARDSKDIRTILAFLRERNPFADVDGDLRSIESGVTAENTVNVDSAEEIGESVIEEMVGKRSDTFSFKRSLQAITLNDKTSVKVSGEGMLIDTQLLFQRLTTAAHRYVDNTAEVFQFELCSIPSSLFDNSGLPRQAQKSTLADALWKQGDCSEEEFGSSDKETCFVIDGGSLIQRLPWTQGSTFGDICNNYCNYLSHKYKGSITVVFDGYMNGPTIKDITHVRRTRGRLGTVVKFSIETPLRVKKEVFLNHPENKQNFIFMAGECLKGRGIAVKHASDDADCLIVNTAIEKASDTSVILVGEDTDLLVLLLFKYSADLKNITFRSDTRKLSGKGQKIWNIRKTKLLLGTELCEALPLLHALTGCDTTSRIFGISKPTTIKTFQKNTEFRAICKAFLNATDLAEIKKSGELLIIALFNGTDSENLDMLRYRKFSSKVVSSTSYVPVSSLPPTTAAASFHTLRVYYQTQIWMDQVSLDPLVYGWQFSQGLMTPIKTCLPPAPEKLLQIVRCNCKTNCDSKKCTCRKHGLECSGACGDCKGVSCSNSLSLADLEVFTYDV